MERVTTAARYCLSRPWWVTFALCALFDGVSVVVVRRPAVLFNAAVFGWGLALSAIFFWWVGVVYRLSPRWAQHILAVSLSCSLLLVVGVNFYVYQEFGQYLTRSMIGFITADPRYVHDYLVTYLFRYNALVLLAVFAALLYLWQPRIGAGDHAPAPLSWRKTSTLCRLALLPALYLLSVPVLRPYTSDTLVPLDTATLFALAPAERAVAKAELHYEPRRLAVAPTSTETAPPNILILASESGGKQQGMPMYGERDNAMPFLTDWVLSDRDHFLVWNNGYTSSTATDVSLPSLVTGVRPDESARKLHLMPLLWQWGKAAGAYTFYLTSVRQSFARLDLFFKCPQRDIALSAENIDSPIVHEAGMDDIVTADHLRDILARKPPNVPFVGMFFTNALHSPFQSESVRIAQMPEFPNRYEKALYIVDSAMKTTVEVLKEQGLLDNTVIFLTADHGETPTQSHTPHRTYSYYEEFFNISYMVHVPERWKALHPDAYRTWKGNETRNVSNLDILPTIVDLLGLTRANESLVAQMKGQSMLRPIDSDRILLGLSTNDVRTWEQEGFGLAWGTYRFVCNNVDGPRFFDLLLDPAEHTDLWRTMEESRKGVIMRTIRGSNHLNRIYSESVH